MKEEEAQCKPGVEQGSREVKSLEGQEAGEVIAEGRRESSKKSRSLPSIQYRLQLKGQRPNQSDGDEPRSAEYMWHHPTEKEKCLSEVASLDFI